jgi:hypothetical protein
MANWSLEEVFGEIDKQAAAAGVNPRVMKALMLAENTATGSLKERSQFRGDAVSPAKAAGLMQVMPDTAIGLQKAGFLPSTWKYDANDLGSNVAAGIAAAREKQGRMNNPEDLAEWASVYNGSSKTHRAYKEGRLEALPTETRNYIQKLRRANMELGGEEAGAQPAGRVMSSNRSTSTSREFDPLMLNDFLATVMGATKPGGTLDQAGASVMKAAGTRDALVGDLTQQLLAQGQAASVTAMAEAATVAAGQAKRQSVLEGLNLDPARTNNELAKLFDTVNRTDEVLNPMKKEIDARMSVGFFDNPLEWMINQTRLPGMVGEYNGIVGTQKDAAQRYALLSDAASKQQALSASTDADLIKATGVAKANEVAIRAAAEATKVNAENAGAAVRDQMILAQLTGQKAQLQGQALATSRESVSTSEGTSEKDLQKQAQQLQLDAVNKMQVAIGNLPITPLQFKTLPAAKREEMISAGQSQKFGSKFGESFPFLYSGNRQKVAEDKGAAMINWTQATNAAASALVQKERDKAVATGNKKFDTEAAMKDTLDMLQEQYQQEANVNMSAASKHNPLALDYVTIVKSPDLKNNALAIWLREFGPSGTKPMMSKVNEQDVINKFATSVELGSMSAGAAAQEISNFYKIGSALQAQNTGYQLFGLNKPEKIYQVTLDRGTSGGAGPNAGTLTAVDLGNAAQVENALTAKVARQAYIRRVTESSDSIFGTGVAP